MGYISTRMMECEDAFSDMGSLKQNLDLPPEYAYDDGAVLSTSMQWLAGAQWQDLPGLTHVGYWVLSAVQTRTASWRMPWSWAAHRILGARPGHERCLSAMEWLSLEVISPSSYSRCIACNLYPQFRKSGLRYRGTAEPQITSGMHGHAPQTGGPLENLARVSGIQRTMVAKQLQHMGIPAATRLK